MTAEAHPFLRLWQSRDASSVGTLMSDDVVLKSPIIRTAFRGRQELTELYAALFQVLEDVTIDPEYTSAASSVFTWTARCGGRPIQGADIVVVSDRGDISEITVLVRPLIGVLTLAGSLGPVLARRRSRTRGFAMRLAAAPMRLVGPIVDAVGTGLSHPRLAK
jgi:hypothetical protein